MTQPSSKRLATEAYVVSKTASLEASIGAAGAAGVVAESAPVTTTNLAANGTFTQTAQDLGSAIADRPTRLRVVVLHTAGIIPGLLILQTSVDNTTWRETWRTLVPSDGVYHTFEAPLHHRYYRLTFFNGATAQTAFWLSTVTTVGESLNDLDRALTFVHSAPGGTTLGASATITGPTLDLGANHRWNSCRFYASATQASTLNVMQSMDNSTWNTVASQAVAANANVVVNMDIAMRYVRYTLVNTVATAGTYKSSMTLIPV